ncbi:mitogen-activated protein kinase kinase kinase 14 [Hippocampus zosterae]|uniref:mitogen-activated protein kinase kinase kinase 14 n=1 Tax=Hippocampus zosterae TaxID=109293 RepID=UPI00223D9EBC|nr:mitogen-activated protein kinase kinase kinase 14 [Hippocampus zosterae]XP_051904589.1 mitogen-activated protein kinase kinase kinase 14 [Hippocampus zosterae]XP_051904590.1 mitogen-activated protein kinase kinase kinase 14 [Hippocampus zosterae]XP_051904591.1 mitogen-activated protein kinase kinase kinase 14 [Hippocampus zosterae]XP_051904592.1 mitogen-activated protein kinase kinase kinase 14 [Hippocampus zosterae]XP_051904593.1 mitogen-activated protein kinase kinase kinase 14 [Hippocamp
MAVSQRILNSTSPFSGSPLADLKASYPKCTAGEKGTQQHHKQQQQQQQQGEEEEDEEQWKSSKVDFIARLSPLLNKVLTQGTAEQVGETSLKSSPFIAQAECETQDSQEFSPSCFERSYVPSSGCFIVSLQPEHNNVACPTTASVQAPTPLGPRKKPRKRVKRKGRKKVPLEKNNKEEERQHSRYHIDTTVPSGVPEQESGSSLEHIQEDSLHAGRSRLRSSCCSSVESAEGEDVVPPLYGTKLYNIGCGCSPLAWAEPFPGTLCSLCSYGPDSDSLSSAGDCSLALAGLRGSVSQGDACYAGPFFKEVERNTGEEEEEKWQSVDNEGIIFYNENIQPVDSEYKEGREFVLSEFIKEGSYGEVHSAQDVNTGFKFAVKKIPLKRFNSEEASTWSALRSPRILELFGVVRDGPYVFFLMDHKSGSLSQMITQRGRLPEDLSLYYLLQVATALEYLAKKKVVHLDVKADNVLLSEDGRDSFLCDFGHAERLDTGGQSLSGSRDLKGTETHMAPEMVMGEPRGARADVWSSCCMLLHMLNGCPPWTRYYTCRLFLKIANDPPPLREIPPDCGPLTAELIKAGLQKDPRKRASASDMKERAARALKQVGGLRSPWRSSYTEPLYFANKPPDSPPVECENDEEKNMDRSSIVELNDGDEDEADVCEQETHFDLNHSKNRITNTVPELELRKLERDFYLSSLSQLHSAEMQEQLLSCLSSDAYSNRDPWDKKDSGRWSLSPTDDYSSGVCSDSSQPEGHQCVSLDLLGHSPPQPCCFQGVDVCIRDFNGTIIQIRETRRVKVGHIATGISDQISERVFTLETQLGCTVAHDEEVQESGLKLCCVPAPDFSASWRWRIRDGALETR